MQRRSRLAFIAALVLVIAAALPVATVRAERVSVPSTIRVATGFMPNVIFTPYYVAQDLGYYKAAGLNVQMNYDRLPDLLQEVADGTFTFGASSGDSAVIARSQGAKVEFVAAQYTSYPVGAMWLKKGGPTINKPSDLKGLNIGVSAPGSSTDYGLDALLKVGGLKRSDVKVTAIGFTETEALINKQIDVAMTFTDNEPVQAAQLGYPVNVMKVSKYVSLTPNGIVTSTSMIKNHAKVVRAFVKATLQGQAYTLAHPDAAFKIAMKRMPEIVDPKDIAIQRAVLAARLAYQTPIKGHPLGWSDPKGWKTTVNFLRSDGITKSSPAPNTMFTNAFVNSLNINVKK